MSSGRLDAALDAERARRDLASVTAAVVSGGRTVWAGGTGTVDGRDGAEVTADTQYRIGSITKTITAVEVMRLRDEGLLDLADRIGDHLPHLPFAHVTIAQLLTHTSGLQAETNGPWWERVPGEAWDDLMTDPPRLVHEPGTRFHYSNVGFAVLGRLVEVRRGAPWFEVVRSEILDPLGMSRTTWDRVEPAATGLSRHPGTERLIREPAPATGAMAPAGQLWSTAQDLARWVAFANGDTGGVLDPATLTAMRIPLAVDDRPGAEWATAQGLGWRIWHGDGYGRQVGHGGSMPGFLATLVAEPQTGLGVVVLANDTNRLGDVDDELLSTARELWPSPARQWRAPTPGVAHLAGDWFWGVVPFRLEPDGDGFVLGVVEGPRRSRFVPDGDGWRGLDAYFAGERLVVRPDGAIDLASFVLTRTPYDTGVEHPGGLDPLGWH